MDENKQRDVKHEVDIARKQISCAHDAEEIEVMVTSERGR